MRLSHKFLLVAVIIGLLLIAYACGPKDESAAQAKTHQDNASSLMAKNDFSGAVDEYTQAIALKPSDITYEGRGQAYTELKEYDKAIADFTKAIELAPSRGGPYFGRGVAYRATDNLDGAIADFSQAIGDRAKTRWRAALLERGLACKAKGNMAEAKADFERILQLEAEKPGEADKRYAEQAQQELATLRQ